ncbi:calcium-activated chloride channel-domain-containing protein [Glomus cerebriforme]|uniref:Calcium-activated chloride channel-domain-containing protein n=1 Tax=Glomus cerebriforme TaxID=658196 RepID=A0A397T249_9GLOM|nr:calcium-activated chloride channel-domain-containing protein [Glomus cerebriforme]
MGDNTTEGMSSSKGQDVKIAVSEEKSFKWTSPRFDNVKSKKVALDYEDELEKVQIIKIELKDNRELHLIDEQDVEVHNKIQNFIEEKPDATLLETVEQFQKYPTSDAIAKVLLEYEYPDYILKYVDDDKKPKKRRKRENFERLLLRSGLILEHEFDSIFECTYIKVFAPFELLCEQARIIKLKMRLDPHYLPEIELDPPARNFFYPITKYFRYEVNITKGSAVFRRDRLRQFEGAGPEKSIGEIVLNFFPSSRRILMVHRIIITANQINRKIYDNEKPLIVKRTIKKLAIKNLVNNGTFMDFYPIHDGPPIVSDKPLEQMNLRAQLNVLWVQPRGRQPLDKIRLYFGEKLALYFAWLGFYNTWLTVASIAGIIVVIYGLLKYYVFKSENEKDFSLIWDNALTAPFAFFMAVWSTCFLETWKQYNISIAYDWDVLDYEKEELPRPEFYGTVLKKSPITLRQEIHFPYREKVKKFLISGVVVFICVIIVIISVTILLLAPKLWINLGEYSSWITASSNLVIIFLMAMLYSYVADWLTSFENHRTDTSYEDSMILKSYFFDFVNCYTGIVYILVFKEKFIKNIINKQGITGCDYNSCMTDLTIQLAILFIGRQMFGQFNEIIWPWLRSVIYKRRIREESKKLVAMYKNSDKSRIEIPQWAKDDKLYSAYGYERGEYEEMVVQFGFISLFGIAFPLAPFFALANNVFEIRSDAFKYIFSLQRTIGTQAQDIGMWEHILNFISLLSVLTNALIMAFHSTWMKNEFARIYGEDENKLLVARLLFILMFENLVFLVKLIFTYMISDVPKQIRLAMDREEYLSKLALEDETPALDEYLSQSPDDSSLFDDDGELKLPKRRRAFTAEEDV